MSRETAIGLVAILLLTSLFFILGLWFAKLIIWMMRNRRPSPTGEWAGGEGGSVGGSSDDDYQHAAYGDGHGSHSGPNDHQGGPHSADGGHHGGDGGGHSGGFDGGGGHGGGDGDGGGGGSGH